MTTRRRGRPWPALLALAALAAALLPLGPAGASHQTLQVTREVNTVLGGDVVTLTARLSAAAESGGVRVNFQALDGPAFGKAIDPCTVAQGESTCSVPVSAGEVGNSLIRAWIDGTTSDAIEGRLAHRSGLGLLDPKADCVTEDDDLLANTCQPQGVTAVPGSAAEPDSTDVVQIEWTTFTDALLDCDDAKPADGEDVEYNNHSSERAEPYSCRLTTRAGAPISGAYVDAEFLAPGVAVNSVATGADLNDICGPTGADGRCGTTTPVSIPGDAKGAVTICFWAEPGTDTVRNTVYNATGADIDGGGCDEGSEVVDEPEGNDITDAVVLDIDNPRPSGLEAGPENQNATRGSRFQLVALVYDQFGFTYAGANVVAELFGGSPLDQDGNSPATPDLTFNCASGQQHCTAWTAAQPDLGTNAACVWIHPAQAPPSMIGDAFNGGTCGDEVPTDPSGEDGRPSPVSDGRDIVRFTIQSRPVIANAAPSEKRQDTTDVLRITGADFLPTARISLSGAGVKLGDTRRLSATQLEATIEVAPGAPPGPRDVTVTNLSDGGTTTCGGCFKVIGQGYWLVASDGGIFSFGDARFAGSAGDRPLNSPIVGMAPTPSGQGYWLVASDGGVFAYGDAPFVGSAGGLALNKPVVGIAAHPSGRGYWLVASDGGIFAFGDARFYGSTGRITLNQPIVGIAAHPFGRGYWLVASDGGIFAFGDARFFGSTGGIALNQPIVGMAATKTGKGYWLVASDGGIFAFGDGGFFGSTGSLKLNRPIVAMARR